MANRNAIKFKDTLIPEQASVIEFSNPVTESHVGVFWRATHPSGILAENGFMTVDDAERLAYWLFAVVDNIRLAQRTPEQEAEDAFQRRWR